MSSGFFIPDGRDLDSLFHPAINIWDRNDRMGFIAPGPNASAGDNSLFRRYCRRGPNVGVDTNHYFNNTDLRNLCGGIVSTTATDTWFPFDIYSDSFNPVTPAFVSLWFGSTIIGDRLAGHAEFVNNQGNSVEMDSWAIGSLPAADAQIRVSFSAGFNPGGGHLGLPTISGPALNTWHDLSTRRSWTVENNQRGGYITSSVTVALRNRLTQAQLFSRSIFIHTYHVPPGGGDPIIT